MAIPNTPTQFRQSLNFDVPSWLSDRAGKNVGFRILWSIATAIDGVIQYAMDGVEARLPGAGTASALPYIGRDRGIIRGAEETDASYADRLVQWLDYWRAAGNAYVLIFALQAYLPVKAKIKLVTRSSVWYTLDVDGSLSFVKASNWDWDSLSNPERAGRWSDFWIIIDPVNFPKDGQWGDGTSFWGEAPKQVFGSDCTAAVAKSVIDIVSQWKGPHTHFDTLILSYNASQFDPLATPGDPGLPDGWYGVWSRNSGGSQIATRTLDARYWELNPNGPPV